jgi:hypothetical protein
VLLGGLVPSDEEDDELIAATGVVDTVAGTRGDAQFRDTLADTARVAGIAERQAADADVELGPCARIAEGLIQSLKVLVSRTVILGIGYPMGCITSSWCRISRVGIAAIPQGRDQHLFSLARPGNRIAFLAAMNPFHGRFGESELARLDRLRAAEGYGATSSGFHFRVLTPNTEKPRTFASTSTFSIS